MRACCAMVLLLGLSTGCVGFQSKPASVPLAVPTAQSVAEKLPASSESVTEVVRLSASSVAKPQASDEVADPLAAVAACLARDDVLGAAAHLDMYVRAHPDQPLFRFQLAELYWRGGRTATAKFHYERFVSDAQSGPLSLRQHLVAAHTS